MSQHAEQIEQNDQTEIWMSALEIALPMYTRAAFPKLKACVDDVTAENDLSKTLEGKSPSWVKFASEAALKAGKVADDALIADVDELLSFPLDGLDDFSLATLAQVFFERGMNEDDHDISNKMLKRNAEVLHQVLISKEVSPLIDYEWLVTELGDNPFFDEESGEIHIL